MSQGKRLPIALCECGTAAIEYAIVLPVLLLLLLGIIDFGRLFWTYTTLHRASDAAARCAAIQAAGCTTIGDTQNYAVAQAFGLVIDASAFAVTDQGCGVQVVATYNFGFVVPWLDVVSSSGTRGSMTLTATACYPD